MIKWQVIDLVLIPLAAFSQTGRLEFIGEYIDFTINPTRFTTNGIYVFVNNTDHDINQSIYFPFPPSADSVYVKRVFNLSYNKNINFQQKEKGIAFKIFASQLDTLKVNISYSQKTEIENEYILVITRYWKNALQFAEYSLTPDESVIIESVSYKPDKIENNYYYWSMTDFIPKENFIVIIKQPAIHP
ncbi:MAG: hypothetical protein JW894_11635 [Bacteroidales bacterium]|nr:hypothetical protein [Bacteroidales bacterium]